MANRWHKQTARLAQRGISIAGGAPMPKATGKGATPLLPDAVHTFLAALEQAHARIAAWLPTIEQGEDASPHERTQASLAIMMAANSLTDAIKELAETTAADAQALGDTRRATAFANIRKIVKQHV